MGKTPDRLQPIEAYALVFEEGLDLQHLEPTNRLLSKGRYPRSRDYRQDIPLPIHSLISDPSAARTFTDQWDQGLVEASGKGKLISDIELRALGLCCGIDDGTIKPEAEAAAELGVSRSQLRGIVVRACSGALDYLAIKFLGQPELRGNLPGIQGRLRAELMLFDHQRQASNRG